MDNPGFIQHQSHVSAGVQVIGGTNYDLSRSAQPTPIQRMPEPAPLPLPEPVPPKNLLSTVYRAKDGVPAGAPALVIHFAQDSATVKLTPDEAAIAKRIGKSALLIAGHSDADEDSPVVLSKQRAEAAGKAVRKFAGARTPAAQLKAFGADLELSEQDPARNQRAEVFVLDEVKSTVKAGAKHKAHATPAAHQSTAAKFKGKCACEEAATQKK